MSKIYELLKSKESKMQFLQWHIVFKSFWADIGHRLDVNLGTSSGRKGIYDFFCELSFVIFWFQINKFDYFMLYFYYDIIRILFDITDRLFDVYVRIKHLFCSILWNKVIIYMIPEYMFIIFTGKGLFRCLCFVCLLNLT